MENLLLDSCTIEHKKLVTMRTTTSQSVYKLCLWVQMSTLVKKVGYIQWISFLTIVSLKFESLIINSPDIKNS